MKGRCCTAVFLAALALLVVSIPGYSKTAAPLRSDHTYVVRRGDNLSKIARANQTTVAALKSANGLKGSRIKAGQTLILSIPGIACSEKEAPRHAEASASRNEETAARHISQLKEQNLIPEDEPPSMRLQLVEAGFKMIGIRYRHSGGSEKTGFDCSGLVKNLFSKFNIELPRSSREQYKQGEKVDRDKLELGDLVFFSSGGSRPTHVGIYIGNDQFLHAARKARRVTVSDLNKIWYAMRYLGARRIADLWGDVTDSDREKSR
jgi:cell wall-associated NlpC family hydrolase